MGFFDTDRWNEIWQTIRRNRKRSIMTALGVFWGIFMLTVLLGAGMGLGRLFRAQLGETSTNTVLMNPGRTSVPYKGMPTGRWWNLENDDIAAVKELPEVKYATGMVWASQFYASRGDRKGEYAVMGHPRLTTVRQPMDAFGVSLATLVLDQIEDRPFQRTGLLPTEVVAR